MKTYRVFSSAQTKELGAKVAARVLAEAANDKKRRRAQVIALHGDLGAGKTTFAQGFLGALGARGRVTSPTFVLMKRFPLGARARTSGFTSAYHIDAYRLRAPRESDTLGLREIFADPQAIAIIEWPERLKGLLPPGKISIRFAHGKQERERVIIAP